MKRAGFLFCLLNVVSILFTAPAYAGINAANGFYLGLGLLGGVYSPPDRAAFTSRFLPITLSLRPYAGYQFNDFLAVEAGFDGLAYDKSESNIGPDEYQLYAFDVAGKLIIPFKSGFSLFGKLGVAFTHQYVYNVVYNNVVANDVTNSILPLFGAGISYNFTQQSAVQLSAARALGNRGIRNIDMVTMGFNYTF